MAGYDGRPLVMEMEREGRFEEASGSGCGCGCFRVFGSKWWQRHEEEGTRLLGQKGEGGDMDGGEIKEGEGGFRSGYFNKKQKNRFQYDEHSYALNFNSGAQSEDEDMPPSFSTRFSAPFTAGRRQNET
ncbi:hypothetical protein SESBI_44296 [Sesbania bispinosa]|nr:hypothetical protein SESBI_44296 [Sesbania bispinosa]